MSKRLPSITRRSQSKTSSKDYKSPYISNVHSRSSSQNLINNSRCHMNQFVGENSYVKLYEPVQRTNRLKQKMSSECNSKTTFIESSFNNYDDSRTQLPQIALIHLEISNNTKKIDNAFIPNRYKTKKLSYVTPSEAKAKLSKRSDWSRKSLFDLPDAKEFLNEQRKKQVEMLMSKYKPEKEYEKKLLQSNLLTSHLLSNPKIDHKKLLNYLRKNQKLNYPPITVDHTKITLLNT